MTSMIVTIIGISALTSVRIRQRMTMTNFDAADARMLARSAVDMGMLIVTYDPNWRTNRANGQWIVNQKLGSGSFTLEVTDPADGDFTNSDLQPVRIRGYGYQGRATAMMEVTMQPTPDAIRPARAATRALGPMAMWPMQDASGTTSTDAIGLQSGTYRNGVALNVLDPNLGDRTAKFDGSNDYVEIPHRSDFLLSNGSISMWFKPDSVTGTRGLMTKVNSLSLTSGQLSIYIDSGRVRAKFSSTLSSRIVSSPSGSVVAGQWYNLVFTFGSGGMKLYLNGSLVDSDSYSGGIGSTEPIAVGVSSSGSLLGLINSWSNPFAGRIAHVAMFNYVMSAAQAASLYSAGNPTRTMTVVPGSWKQIVN
ncbi:MAG: hypothetical protein GC162_03430 [Planctomycetes bacterium]|nr:hypothetical protein [Planctomycetota bacterium]